MLKTFARFLPRVALLAVPAFALALPAIAAAATPSPSPAPTPNGFTAHGHADVGFVSSGRTMAGSITMAMEQRGNVSRVDILSVKSDAMPLPPVHFTVLFDRNINSLTVWNDTTKRYYTQTIIPKPAVSATPLPTGAPVSMVSPFAGLDIFSMSVKLTGHTMTGGIPTTGLAFDIVGAKKGETATSHLTATTQIADEFAFFPMSLDVTVEPASSTTKVNMSYVVDDFTRGVPPRADFVVPVGYTKTKNAMDAITPRPTREIPAH